jgi:hypothetical protein
MNLFDDSTVRNFDSSPETMTSTHDAHTGGPAVLDAPELAQPSPADLNASAEPASSQHDAPEDGVASDHVPETRASSEVEAKAS